MSLNSVRSQLHYLVSVIVCVFAFNLGLAQLPIINGSFPRHETLDQQTIAVYFNFYMQGTSTIAQWKVFVDTDGAGPILPVSVPVVGIRSGVFPTVETSGAFGPSTIIATSPPRSAFAIRFDASLIPGHPAYLLPGETLTVSFTNTGNTVLTFQNPGPVPPILVPDGGDGVPILDFGPITSRNNYLPAAAGANDIIYNGSAVASANGGQLDQCAPVNTDFIAFTYVYSLRFRNSTNWVTTNNRLRVNWSPGTSDLQGYLSNGAGDNQPNNPPIGAGGPGGGPGVFVSFRSGLDPVLAAAGVPFTTFMNGTNPFSYPRSTTGICNYRATYYPIGVGTAIYDAIGNPSLTRSQQFDSYDFDNTNTSTVSLTPVVPPASGTLTTDRVCVGVNVQARFLDTSTFNCIGNGSNLLTPAQGAAANPINNQQRWVRIIYGGANSGTPANVIPNVFVDGVQVTDASGALVAPWNTGGGILPGPALNAPLTSKPDPNASPMPVGYVKTGPGGIPGVPDGNGVIELPANATIPSVVTELITTSSAVGQVPGQRFYVTIQYWGVCNRYDLGFKPVEVSNRFIEIITTPPAITFTPNPPNFCESEANGNYLLTQSGGTTGVYNWYSTFPPVVAGDLEKTGSTFNPITEASVPGVVSKTPASTTTTNFFITQTAVNGCESLPTPVPFKIIKNVTGGTITHPGPNPICSGDTPAAFANSVLPTGGDGVGTYTYQWKVSTTSGGPYVNAVGAGATTAGPFTPSAAITQTSFYVREATSGTKAGTGTCTVALSNQITITVHTTPTPGTVTANQTICEVPGDPVNLTQTVAPTGGNGIYTFQWQSATAIGGPYSNIVGATSSNFDPPAGLLVTTFYRRVVTSGFCPVNTAATLPITITVHNIVNSGTIGNTQTICSGQTPVGLTGTPATGGDGSTYFYQWEQSTTGAGGPYSNASGVSTTQNYNPPALITTTHYRRRSTSLTCPSTNSNIIQIAVNPLPTAANPSGGGAVCGGNPAPDIDWALTGTPPFNVTYNQTPGGPVVVTNWPANTFTISAPSPGVNTIYQLTALTDMNGNGCAATSLGGTASVTIGGTPPILDSGPTLNPISACFNGALTPDPTVLFSLAPASASTAGFTLTYTIDGSANRTKVFATDAAGDPSIPITFNDAEFNSLLPSPHTFNFVSILSATGCLTTFNIPVTFTVNPLPANPTGGVGAIACNTSPTGALISVANPGPGFAIEWYTDAAGTIAAAGAVSGAQNQNFTPTSNATATYFTFTRNTATACRSAASLGVLHTQDVSPAAAVAGANQPNVCAGTPSVALAATAATNGGNGSWTIPGRVAYYQNFTNFANGVTSSSSLNGWSVNTSGANVFTGGAGYFRVESNRFEANNTNGSLGGGAGNIGEVVWNSAVIDISSLTSATATVDLINISNDLLAPEDYIRVFYKLNGGPEIAFTTNGNLTGNFLNSTASVSGLVGATLQVVVRVSNDAATNRIAFDNVFVRDASAASITFSDANSPTSTVSNLPAPIPGGVAQTTILRWTVQSALGVCAPTFSNVSITINPLPTAVDPAPVLCETTAGGGSVANVDLTTYNSAVTNTVAVPGTTVQWFSNAARTIPVVGNVTVINGNIFYFRATSPAPFNCVNVGLMTFTINPKPVANAAVYDVCEDSPPGTLQGTIDLTTAAIKTDIIGFAALPAQRNVTWFSSLAEAISNTNPVVSPSNFVVTADVEVFARVENTVTGCTNQSTVTLQYKARPANNSIIDVNNNSLTGNTLPLSGTLSVCASRTGVQFFQVDPAVNPGSTYNWVIPAPSYTVPANFFGPGDPSIATPEFEVFPGGTFFRIIRFNYSTTSPPLGFVSNFAAGIPIKVNEGLITGCDGNPITLTVNVNSAPTKPEILGGPFPGVVSPLNVCTNQLGVIFSISNPSAGTYNWEISGNPVPGQTGSSITVDWGALNGSVKVKQTSGSCVSPESDPFNVIVNQRPFLANLNKAECSDVISGITLAAGGSVPATTFRLINVVVDPGLIPSSRPFNPLTPVLSSEIFNDSFKNTNGGSLRVRYTVVPVSAAGCEGPPTDVIFTVRAEPTLDISLNKTICSREIYNLNLRVATGSKGAVGYRILGIQFFDISNNPVPALTPSTGNPTTDPLELLPLVSASELADDSWINTTNAAVKVVYSIRPESNEGCKGAPPFPLEMVVEPEPVLNVSPSLNPPAICSGDSPTVVFSSTNLPASTYSWEFKSATSILITGFSLGAQTGSTITDVLINPTASTETVVYTVTPKFGNCSGQPLDVNIQVSPSPTANPINSSTCSDNVGGNTATVDLTALQTSVNSGGGITFLWFQDNAKTIPITAVSVPPVTAYVMTSGVPVFVEVDNGSCKKIVPVNFTVNPKPSLTASATSNYFGGFNIRCVGDPNGVITATPTNGTAPYQYSIDGGVTFFNSPVFNGLSFAGNPYTVTVRDSRGCTASATGINLTQPTPVNASTAVNSNVACNLETTGQVTVLGSGGVGPYTYQLIELPSNTSGNTSGVYTGLRAGAYTFLVKDANTCQFTTSTVTVTEPTAIDASASLATPVSCNGLSTGVIAVTASGGTVATTYSYTISPGGTTNSTGTFAGLAQGNYTVTVKDDNNCTRVTNTVTVTQPAVLTIFASVSEQTSCNGANDAEITAVANGGNGGYGYTIAGPTVNLTGATTGTFVGLSPGVYTVTVTDLLGCTSTSSNVTVTQPTVIVPTTFISKPISCNGESDGEIRVNASGGTGVFTFQLLPGGPTNMTGVFGGLADGNYNFRVTDANGCFTSVNRTINQPTLVIASVAVTSNYNGSQITCDDGSANGVITVTASGGTGTLQYVFDQFPLANTTGQFSGIFTNIPAGSGYTFTVKDANNCSVGAGPITVTQPTPVSIVSATFTSPSCVGGTNGQITVVPTGGTVTIPKPYRFQLDQAISNTTGNASGVYTGLVAGTYTVTVSDANNCSVTTGLITVAPPTAITFTSASVTSNYNGRQIRCVGASDGIISASATGGAGVFTYVLKNSLGNQVGASNATGTFSGLPADTYTVTATDANNCPKVSPPITISPPPPLTTSASVTSNFSGQQISCNGESDGVITVLASGGTGAYDYKLTKIPVNIVNTTGATSGIFTGLSSGTYRFTVADANSCSVITSTVAITDPTSITGSALVTSNYFGSQISCATATDAAITVTASGGTGQLQYVFNQFAVPNITGKFTGQFINVPAGTNYTFTITDLNGCPFTTAPINVTAPPALVATAAASSNFNGFNVSCRNLPDGQLIVTGINGGTGALTYLLLEDSSNPAAVVSATSVQFDNLRAGSYRVRITDVNNCSITLPAVTITQPPDITFAIQKNSPYNGKDVSCAGASDGSISLVSITGGAGASPGYTYVLDQNIFNSTGATTGNFTGLASGVYTVTVTDGNGCKKTSLPVVLTDPLPLFEGIIAFDKSVCLGEDPTALIELAPPFGGIGSYAYQWQQSTDNITFTDVVGATNATFDPPIITVTTNYRRKITSGSCATLTSNTVTITVNPLPTATFGPSITPVCQGGSFLLNFNFTGAAPFYFDYNDGTTTTSRVGATITQVPVSNFLNTTTYTLTALKDFNGCDAVGLPISTIVPVKKISSDFAITSPVAQCAGSTFIFQWTVDPGVEYTWFWPDGTAQLFPVGTPLGLNSVSRVISSPNTSGNLTIPITLQAINNVDGCGPLSTSKQVTILQSVVANISADKTRMCSGDVITLTNATQGATTHTWTYQDLTTNTVVNLPSTYNVNFPIVNNTTVNNQTYRITYTGSNSSCSASGTRDVIVNYNVDPQFTNGAIPSWLNQRSIVDFTNTSSLSGSQSTDSDFNWSWDFGNDSDVKKTNLVGRPSPITVKFISNPADRAITLRGENKLNAACSNTISKTIQIPLEPITAEFNATPETCFPSPILIPANDIKILGEVDSIAWVVRDQDNKIVARSSGYPTKFDVPYPGKFTISLTVGNTFTGVQVPATSRVVNVYDKPLSTFDLRPDIVYVPDTEMSTFNFSNGANQYLWDFGDGGTSTDFEPKYTYAIEGKYDVTLIARFDHGNGIVCSDTLTRTIIAKQGGLAKIPNSFTPNPNGRSSTGTGGNGTFNDVFLPLIKGISNDSDAYNLQIYDRWGNLVFESTSSVVGWDGYNKDGKLMPAGVYVYKLTVRFSDSQRTTTVGDITMLY